MKRVTLSSPAKLNLFLKVCGKRPDGYHEIVTVFERIDLADRISFWPTTDRAIRIRCDHNQVPVGSRNLVFKAAQLLREECGIRQGARIKIEKKIPVAAGLAGGSSNAATALIGLNKIWNLRLENAKLIALARKIGSDVPFFLNDTSWALGTGRGDRIKKLDIKARFWHILVVPKVKMYSWKVYQALQSQLISAQNQKSRGLHSPDRGGTNVLTKINDNANILIHKLKKDNVLDVGFELSNDLETEIFRLYPPLRKLKERLKSLNTKGVMVSGSGPCVFGLAETVQDARSFKKALLKRHSQVFIVRTL